MAAHIGPERSEAFIRRLASAVVLQGNVIARVLSEQSMRMTTRRSLRSSFSSRTKWTSSSSS